MPLKDPIKRKAYLKQYVEDNKDRLYAANRAWPKKNPERAKDSELRRRYGISLAQYHVMLTKQDGVCKICKGPQKAGHKYFSVDHCHVTKKVRGLLCHRCNRMIGFACDSVLLLESAIAYLKEHR